jgi:hypothetical protein
LGSLHMFGKLAQDVDPASPLFKEFVGAFLRSAQYPEMKEIVTLLLNVSESSQERGEELLWKLMRDFMGLVGQSSDETGGEFSKLNETVKKTFFYSLIAMNRLNEAARAQTIGQEGVQDGARNKDLTELFLRRTLQVLKGHRDFLFRSSQKLLADLTLVESLPDLFQGLVESPDPERDRIFHAFLWDLLEGDATDSSSDRVEDGVQVLKALYEWEPEGQLLAQGVIADSILSPWKQFLQAWKGLRANEEYRSLDFRSLIRPVLDFFEEGFESSRGTEEYQRIKDLPRKLRTYLADLLQSGQAHEFVVLLGENPEEFSRILREVSPYLDPKQRGKDLEDFFEMVNRSLSAPR